MEKRQIVITGIGVISPIGICKEPFWRSLQEGRSGIKPIGLFDTSKYKVKKAGEISDFDPETIFEKRELLDLDRSAKLLLCSAKLAMEDAGLMINEGNSSQVGVCVGTTLGSLDSYSKFDREALTESPRYANPSVFINSVVNAPASRVGIKFKITGLNSTLSTGMCAALDALDYACDFIKLNRIQTALAGSVEDLSLEAFLGCYKLGCLSGFNTKTETVSCPFDKRRNGIILAEGAVTFIVEGLETALKRQAPIYAEILGTASCFDPGRSYQYNPKATGMVTAMTMALKDAGLKPQDIDCIFANANSTQDADSIEVKAIRKVFGNKSRVPVTSVKSNIGESFAVSGGFALAAAIGALENGLLPPLINYTKPDPLCDLNFVLKGDKNKKLSLRSKIMINTFSANEANTVTIIGKLT